MIARYFAALVGLAVLAAPMAAFGADKKAADAMAKAPEPIALTDKYPTVGRATTIVLAETTDRIEIVYAPDAPSVSTSETLDPQGSTNVLWRPKRAGVAKIKVGAATKAVSIKFDGFPGAGLGILLFAALILFGGAALSLRSLLTAPDHADADDRT